MHCVVYSIQDGHMLAVKAGLVLRAIMVLVKHSNGDKTVNLHGCHIQGKVSRRGLSLPASPRWSMLLIKLFRSRTAYGL